MEHAVFERSTVDNIKLQLKEVEREQKKKRRDLEIKEAEKNEKIKEAMSAKKVGKHELLRDLFRELRQMEIDTLPQYGPPPSVTFQNGPSLVCPQNGDAFPEAGPQEPGTPSDAVQG